MPTFKLSVINDEITQDFGRACEVAAQEFGLQFIEIREMWGKNIMRLDAKEIDEARKILEKYKLRVSSVASPIFKVDWPGAPTSKFSPKRDQFGADFTFEQQDELLQRGFELTRVFQVDRIRLFDFWRLEEQQPYRAAIDDKLREAAKKAEKRGVILLLENEPACNTATGEEAGRTLGAVRSPNLMLNWDAGNAASRGEIAYPDGHSHIPKNRIGYLHCKDVIHNDGKYEWMKMGGGIIDWVGQYSALKKDGYRGVLSLETHWRGAGTPEESTRQSMAGVKDLLRRAGAL